MRLKVYLINRIVILSIVCLFLVGTAQAATFVVNSTNDGVDANIGDNVCETAMNLTTNDTSEFSNVKQVLNPSAASVSIGGRVLNAAGSGVFGARVIMTDTNGNVRETRTSSFGFYSFAEVAAGETYILTVRHKRYEFAPQVVFVTEESSDINFIASTNK